MHYLMTHAIAKTVRLLSPNARSYNYEPTQASLTNNTAHKLLFRSLLNTSFTSELMTTAEANWNLVNKPEVQSIKLDWRCWLELL